MIKDLAVLLILIAVILFVILFTHVRLRITYKKSGAGSVGSIYIQYLFIKIRIYPQKKKTDKEGGEKPQKELSEYQLGIKKILRLFEEIKDDIIKILYYASERLIRIENLNFNFKFGLDDPMDTGILTGAVNGAVYTVLGVVHNHSYIENCDINITPDFDNVCHFLKINCIIRMRNVHITVILIKIIKILIKLKKALRNEPEERK